MKKILHIIQRQKFTNGYIQFMESQYTQYEHYFITNKGEFEINKSSNLYEVDTFNDIYINKDYLQFLRLADKIIISGVWIPIKLLLVLIRKKFIGKTFFHFWGGDFYCFKDSLKTNKNKLREFIIFNAFKKCSGLIFLIDGEYEIFRNITHVTNNHFIAAMPDDPKMIIDYSQYRNRNKNQDGKKNILIGNSATPSNCHAEVFKLLEHFSLDNINIFCPLSYGDNDYKIKIIKEGKEKFGEAFQPIEEYMDRNDYLMFLSEMDIGIFYNDRQQATGNIVSLFAFGKKVFLRPGTSMWSDFINHGYNLYNANEIGKMSISEFFEVNQDAMQENIRIREKEYAEFFTSTRDSWNKIFEL